MDEKLVRDEGTKYNCGREKEQAVNGQQEKVKKKEGLSKFLGIRNYLII